MAGVMVDSGEFKLMRNVDVSHQPARSEVYNEWIKAFSYNVPEAIEHLSDVIEDVYTYELWKDKYLDTPEQFFERIGIFGLDLEEPAKLIKELRKKKSSKKTAILKRIEKAKELREQGMTQREIADELGVGVATVNRDCSKNEVRTQKMEQTKPKRNIIRYEISQYTKPETAAEMILKTFGEEFSKSLLDELSNLLNA